MAVFAEGEEQSMAQIVYDDYTVLQEALESNVYATLKNAVDSFDTAAYEALESDDREALAELMDVKATEEKTAGEVAYYMILSDWIDANILLEMGEVYNAYLDDPTDVQMAYAFTDYYENIANHDNSEGYYLNLVTTFYTDIAGNYIAAANILPPEEVLYVYQSFLPVQEALEYGNIAGLEEAVENFYDGVVDVFNELNEEELNGLAALMGAEDGAEAYEWLLSDWVDANVILEVDKVFSAYANDPNLETATKLVDMIEGYDEMYGEDRDLLYTFYGEEFDDFYNGAVKMVIFGNTTVEDVYNAITAVQIALESGNLDQLKAAVAGFEAVLEVFNAFEEEEYVELAMLMGVEATETETAEELAFGMVLGSWIDANVVMSVVEVYDAYVANPNKETAKALIEKLESYDETYEDRSLIKSFLSDIDDVYAAAVAVVSGITPTITVTPETPSDSNTNSGTAVKTGDNSNVWLWFVLAAVCGSMACGVALRKRNVK